MGYRKTIMYTVLNVALSLFIIIPAGYALSRRDLPGRNIFMFLIVFTMFFSGGIIPNYLVVRGLGMINTRSEERRVGKEGNSRGRLNGSRTESGQACTSSEI